MKILKKLLLGIVVILVLLVVVSFFLPSTYKVERSTVIKTPVAKVFNEFNDLNNWLNWNAFDDEFTDIKYTTTSPSSGVNAKQSWESEKMNGSMTIVESVPDKLVNLKLMFEGFDDPLKVNIQLEPVAEGTKVTWTDEGKSGNNPIYKYMCLMMDSMMGSSMEKSFDNIKKICEE